VIGLRGLDHEQQRDLPSPLPRAKTDRMNRQSPPSHVGERSIVFAKLAQFISRLARLRRAYRTSTDVKSGCARPHRGSTIRSSCGRLGRVTRQICCLLASSAALSTAAVSGCHRWLYHCSPGFVQVPAVEVERSLDYRAGRGGDQSSALASARSNHPTRRHGDRVCLHAAHPTDNRYKTQRSRASEPPFAAERQQVGSAVHHRNRQSYG